MAGSSTSRHERFNFPDRESLIRKIRSLHVDIPLADQVDNLFEPIELAGKSIPNRFAVQPMEGADGDRGGAPGELTLRRYRRFAEGGSGLIWFEATAVRLDARSNPSQLCLTRDNGDTFCRLVEETRAAARKSMGHEIVLLLQLTHPGRYTRFEGAFRPISAQHNPVLDPLQGLQDSHPLIRDEELDSLQEDFIHAAALAAAAGFDGVDVKACHGYLVSELLAARTRDDSRYGGSFENRSRFLLEVIRRIREHVPGLFVTARINAYDGIPYPHGFGANPTGPTGEDLSEPLALVKALEALGVPLLNVTLGIPYYNAHYGRPYDLATTDGTLPAEHPLCGVARLLRITGELQRAFPGLPMVGTGYSWLRQYFPQVGAAIIRASKAAFTGIGRGAFAYPDCVRDLKERGALDPGKVCIGCSRCTQIIWDGGSTGCAVRDRTVYQPIFQAGRRRAKRRPAGRVES
jgi:2,4-dienoyl-CoA reductase-like NADH-dependent reductase (Old Yellow Enzyme family)